MCAKLSSGVGVEDGLHPGWGFLFAFIQASSKDVPSLVLASSSLEEREKDRLDFLTHLSINVSAP